MGSRIGRKDEKGAVIQWPESDINGAAYSRPATMIGLDATHFVIVPAHYADWDRIEWMRQSLKDGKLADVKRSDETWTHTFPFDGELGNMSPAAEPADTMNDDASAAPKGRKAKRERPDTE